MKFILTEKGKELQAQVEAGLQLVISRIAVSSELSDQPGKLEAVPSEVQELQIDGVAPDGDRAVITAALSNMQVDESYMLHMIGVYALDESGDEILFLIGQDTVGDEIKPGVEEEIILEYNIALKVSNAEQVIFCRNLDDYVRKSQFYEHAENFDNPHRTTKAQVGLSEVPNVSTNHQTPTWERAAKRILPESGDTLDVIMGKIEKYLSDLKQLAFTGEVKFENFSTELQNRFLTYCPFVSMFQDIPVYERKENKMYLMVTETRGVTVNYCSQYIFMPEDISADAREDLAIYGKETTEKSSLEEWDRLVILKMMDPVILTSRELQEGEVRDRDTFYLYETEEKRIWQE